MNKIDYIFAIICGLAVAWIATDFFSRYIWIFFPGFPILAIIGLAIANFISRKVRFAGQAGKFVLAGAFADVIDIKVFQLLFLFAPLSVVFKGISFLVATAIKFLANKHWTFEKPGKDGIKKEMVQFLLVTLVGLAIDVVAFYFFGRINTGISTKLWVELSIILAALAAAVWNFLGYKYLVFKK